MKDCCCKYAPRLRDIEARVEDLLEMVKTSVDGIDSDLVKGVLAGDLSRLFELLKSGDLSELFGLVLLIPDVERVASDHKAIVAEMEACCADDQDDVGERQRHQRIALREPPKIGDPLDHTALLAHRQNDQKRCASGEANPPSQDRQS